jgi:EAL domain-containing protein (putative c-di-GMP-specific phosphodiesterase class I)
MNLSTWLAATRHRTRTLSRHRLLALWSAGSEAGEGRRLAPRLRPLACAGLGLSFGLIIALFAFGTVQWQLRQDQTALLHAAQGALTQAFQEVNTELSQLDTQSHSIRLPNIDPAGEPNCNIELREHLARASIQSLLVREFMTQDSGGQTCSAFGLIAPFWSAGALTTGAVQLLPAQKLRAGIVMARADATAPGNTRLAYIEPRQLTDRLPAQAHAMGIRMLDPQGKLLAFLGEAGTAQSTQTVALQLDDWPVTLETRIGEQAWLHTLKPQALGWIGLWALLSGLAVRRVNLRLRAQASRAVKLQRALRKRRFAPVVQPIVDAQSGACLGVEVLMRWKHPQRGLVPPAEFIDYAERSGLIVPMSDLLMRQAHHQLAQVAIAHPHLYFSFNVTPAQLRTPGFAQTLLEIFDGQPIGPQRVVIELTERDLVDDQVRDELTRIRALGFRIAIDDFGTGQSSLALLQDLSLDLLKIDRAFVMTISENPHGQPVLDAIIHMAQRLHLKMIGEGIETEQQQAYLHAAGVQALQGYRFSRPLPPSDFEVWLEPGVSDRRSASALAHEQAQLVEVMHQLDAARARLQKHQWYRFRRYTQVMVGSELIDWMVRERACTRAQALRLGQQLVARGWLAHVASEHDFEDAFLFYRLIPLSAMSETMQSHRINPAHPAQWLGWLQGPHGIRPGTCNKGLLQYRDAVSGRSIVKALMRTGAMSQADAVAAGIHLMRTGHLRHVFDEQGFMDSPSEHYHFAR